VQIAELTGSLRELDTLAEIASLKQQIASEQLQAVLAQLELGNGAGGGAAATDAQGRTTGPHRRAPFSLRICDSKPYHSAAASAVETARRAATTARFPAMP
jgi:hypothetical protein